MRKNSFKAEEHIADLNTLKTARQLSGGTFIKEALISDFKRISLPTSVRFFAACLKVNIVAKQGKGQYYFPSDKPIYKDKLQNAYNIFNEECRRYNRNSKSNSVIEEATIDIVENTLVQVKDPIQEAILLLKENGYKVFAPVCKVYSEV